MNHEQIGLVSSVDAGRDPASATPHTGADGRDAGDEPVLLIDDTKPNRAGLSDSEVDKLVAGGPIGALKWLYPYEGTVLPGGPVAPLLMWSGEAATDAVYVRIKSRALDYRTVLKPDLSTSEPLPGLKLGAALRATIPPESWAIVVAKSRGKGDTFTVELTERVNGEIHGPLVLHVEVAGSPFRGSIYYSTCHSQIDGPEFGGRLLRIRPNGDVEYVPNPPQSGGQCLGCHSVSADGLRLIAQWGPDPREGQFGKGLSFQLAPDGTAQPTAGSPAGPLASYGALYPDGSKYLSTHMPTFDSPMFNYGMLRSFGTPAQDLGVAGIVIAALSSPATLYDVDSTTPVPNTGIPETATMPMFSPDGTRLVFNDHAINGGRGLAIMDYDVRAHKASNYRVLYLEPDVTGTYHPAWPFFLPNNQAVVFVRDDSDLFTSGTSIGGGINPGDTGHPSNLYIVDVETGIANILARAMGFDQPSDAASNKTYLPFGDSDINQNYFPTVSPVAAGGYFWVFFDSLRIYGTFGAQRALLGFAIDIRSRGGYTTDPSYPAFHLIGQENVMELGNNHRAFAARDKCRPEKAKCSSGIDCCTGRCADNGLCVPPQGACAKTDEGCQTNEDCCPPEGNDPPNQCIAGFCAYVPPILF